MTSYGETQEHIYPMRLQKFLARAGAASRRGSENLMTAGRVTVNGEVVTELGSKVDPRVDTICLDGKVLSLFNEAATLMLHKPAGYLSSMSDPFDRACVSELVPLQEYPGLFPIGRLDVDTTGLLLFSTDGDLGNLLLHPRHHVDKSYEALVLGSPSAQELQQLERGIVLEDGLTAPAQTFKVKRPIQQAPSHMSWVGLTIHEGKKHQVKRMFEALGHPVKMLHRSQVGPCKLKDLPLGAWRKLSESELKALRAAAQIEPNDKSR